MKTKKWWFYFTLAAAMIIATIITNMLYINGLEKIVIFGSCSVWIYLTVSMLQVINGGKTNIAFVVSLLIFCSSSFFLIGKRNEFVVFCHTGQMPVVLECNLKLAIPYTYDAVIFNCRQKLVIMDNNRKAMVDFELSGDDVFMIQHGFSGQEDYAKTIQKKADSRFFQMNYSEMVAYLESFEMYGLRWKKAIVEINNIQ